MLGHRRNLPAEPVALVDFDPFGQASVTLEMLRRMFYGDDASHLHDRILDVSTATTGTLFFAPSAAYLASLGDAAPNPVP